MRFLRDNSNPPRANAQQGRSPLCHLPLGTIVGNPAAVLPVLATSFICNLCMVRSQLCADGLAHAMGCAPHVGREP